MTTFESCIEGKRFSRNLVRWACLGATCGALAACGLFNRPKVEERAPKSFEEAGAVEVAVISVARWESLIKPLIADFEIDGKTALATAIATTRQTQEQTLSAVQFVLRAAFGGTADSNETTRSARTAAGATTEESASTSRSARSPGDISQVPAPALPGAPAAASAPAPLAIGHDAITQYQLASALLQEVQLLNSYVRDAPKLAGYEPFVVRLQVSVRPKGRNNPVDANVNVSFLPKQLGDDPPIVVPLLVTDSLDATSALDFKHQIAQLGLALGALKGNTSVLSSYGKTTEDIAQAIGWQYNSQLTVGRPTPNSVSARIGAMPVSLNRFDLVPRTRNISVLLLVKRPIGGDVATVRYTSRAEFSLARTGEPLPSERSSPEQIATQILVRYPTLSNCSSSFLGALGAVGQRDATARTDPCLRLSGLNAEVTAQLFWSELAAALSSGPIGFGEFETHFWPSAQLPPGPRAVASLLVTGAKEPYGATTTLLGGANLTERDVARGSIALGPMGELRANDVSIVESRTGVQLEFRNLSQVVLDWLGAQSELSITLQGKTGVTQIAATGGVVRRDEPKPNALSSVVKTGPQAFVSAKNETVLTLGVRLPKPVGDKKSLVTSLLLEFAGGIPYAVTRTDAQPACASLQAASIVVTADCNFDVGVRNVKAPPRDQCCDTPPSELSISLVEKAGDKSHAVGSGPSVRLVDGRQAPLLVLPFRQIGAARPAAEDAPRPAPKRTAAAAVPASAPGSATVWGSAPEAPATASSPARR